MTLEIAELIAHFYDSAPGFTGRLQAAGLTPDDLQAVEDLAKLPVLRKDDLMELQRQDPPFGGMLAIPISDLAAVFQSPGPIYEPGLSGSRFGGWTSALESAGFRSGEVVINAFGYHMTPAGLSFHYGLDAMGCVVLPGGIGNQDQQIEAMAAFGVTGYVGLPSYLKALLDRAEEQGFALKLSHALVLAEPLPDSLRQELKRRGVAVFQAYGTAECGNLGYECGEQSGWHIPDNVIVQICDINSGEPLPDGETGEVVATLLSDHYAIIRFGVGDLSSINPEPCPCGRESRRLNGWQGRIGAATKVRGMFLHPAQLSAMMKRFPEVARFQALVTREEHRDALAIHVLPKAGADLNDLVPRIRETAREAIKFRVRVAIVDEVMLPEGSPPIKDERSWE